jgi:hypothetical protein
MVAAHRVHRLARTRRRESATGQGPRTARAQVIRAVDRAFGCRADDSRLSAGGGPTGADGHAGQCRDDDAQAHGDGTDRGLGASTAAGLGWHTVPIDGQRGPRAHTRRIGRSGSLRSVDRPGAADVSARAVGPHAERRPEHPVSVGVRPSEACRRKRNAGTPGRGRELERGSGLVDCTSSGCRRRARNQRVVNVSVERTPVAGPLKRDMGRDGVESPASTASNASSRPRSLRCGWARSRTAA